MIYFDNAATTWPKPSCVPDALVQFFHETGANPGRSGHRLSVKAARVVYDAREAVAELFNAPDPFRVVFSHNATAALNQAIHGLLRPGDHVITSSVEHNSVMRPLRVQEERGVRISVVPCAPDGQLEPEKIEQAIQPNTTLIALTHASNVTGTILPVDQVGQIARQNGVLLLCDAAQTAGVYPIDMQAGAIDLLAFTGHKGLYGPTGTGGLVLGERVDLGRLEPLMQGGTGSRSEQERQPDFLPDRYESGTCNAAGLAGLGAGVRWLMERGVEAVWSHEAGLCERLLEGLADIRGVTIYGPLDPAARTAVVSFNIAGVEPSEAGLTLDEEYGILCRVGLHCAPAAHHTIGSFPRGAVRFSLGAFNTLSEVETGLKAVSAIAKGDHR
jgi:cysteine desulfurase / selenocysteine lyase